MMRFIDGAGRPSSASDPKRQVWYSALCSYWTDDWTKLKKLHNGIPCCPHCGSPGMMVVFSNWEAGAKEHDKNEPGYSQFISEHKEECHQRNTGGMAAYWKLYRAIKEYNDAEGRGDSSGGTSRTTISDERREGDSR